MKKQMVEVVTVAAALFFLSISALALNAEARAGGGRSSGGSRSYSRPASPSPQQSQPRQQVAPAPAPAPVQQPGGGGFMRSMAGGMMGGLLGGMLFSSFAGAGEGMGGMGGSGIGLFEILLLAGGGYLIFRYIKKKRGAGSSHLSGQEGSGFSLTGTELSPEPQAGGVETGIAYIRQMDPSFDVACFNDLAMDIFFKIQGAWMSRDLSPVTGLLTDEMKEVFQRDLNQLLRQKQVNRLENIAVRKVELAEVWQETGQDYVTVSIYANLLDYTVDDLSGEVVSGSKAEPIKFEEFWTFTRPVGNNSWQLSAINQK